MMNVCHTMLLQRAESMRTIELGGSDLVVDRRVDLHARSYAIIGIEASSSRLA
jgi:hypothetical protein